MIEIREGRLVSGKRAGSRSVLDNIYCDGVGVGFSPKLPGAGASMTAVISEAVEHEIRKALDERDGEAYPDRVIKLHPRDPRAGHNVSRQSQAVHRE